MMNGRQKNSLNYPELYDEVTAFAHFGGFFFPSCPIHTQKIYPNLCPRQKTLILDPFSHQNQRIARCMSLESVHYIISDHVSADELIKSDFLSTQDQNVDIHSLKI